MQLSERFSLLAFLVVPLALWFIAASTAWRSTSGSGLRKFFAITSAFVAGADGRLSLSRLQAFTWTLVIYGAYAAAFFIHVPYAPDPTITAAQADTLVIDARRTLARADSMKRAAVLRIGELELSARSLRRGVEDDSTLLAALERQQSADPAALLARNARASTLRAALLDLSAREQAALATTSITRARLDSASAIHASALSSVDEVRRRVAALNWIGIPAALLALAGLSIGTGVLSALISNVSDSAKDACVTALSVVPHDAALSTEFPGLGVPRKPGWPCAVIRGRDLGTSGYVRLGSVYADVLYWGSDGHSVVAQIPAEFVDGTKPIPEIVVGKMPSKVTVDTTNGKRSYRLITHGASDVQLGESLTSYDWLDLFRDDRNPAALAMTKFQMFGWTVIAVSMYVYTFWRLIQRPDAPFMASLPDVDESLVILMGVSQAAYLTGKAISGVSAPPTTPVAATTTTAAPTAASPPAESAPVFAGGGEPAVVAPSVERVAPPGPLPSDE